ncbi:MAG: HYR domain-containing protein [Saprospiraceae bacterium]
MTFTKITITTGLLVFFLCLSAFHSTPQPKAALESLMPVFVDTPPSDITVDCVADVPAPVDLTANDGMGGADFEVSPTDSPDVSLIDPCSGGVVVRSWQAIIGLDTTTVSQTITVLADNTPPMANLPVVHDTVACELAFATAPANPDRYDVWLSSLRLALSTNATDDCVGGVSVTDDGGAALTEACATRTVTFTLTDACNNASSWVATYTTIDTLRPVFTGVPPNDTLNCTEMVPAPPTVTVTDNCTPNLVATFVEGSSQTNNGSCSDYEYNVLRTWIASDSCGNTTVMSQLIRVVDEEPPTYTAPPSLTISCSQDPNDLSITGNVTNVMDNCSPTLDTAYTDQVTPGSCPDEATIIRLWRITDLCGNVAGKVQTINVADIQAPSFNVPPNITVDCSDADNLAITGSPLNVLDDCDPNPSVNFVDEIFPGSCPNAYLVRRRWRVTDRCGATTEQIQEITVEDQENPFFSQMPVGQTVSCDGTTDITQLYQNWLANRAGATASDNCTLVGDISWQVYAAGTTNPPSLEVQSCPVADQVVQISVVDFIITDECGRTTTASATFRVIDQTAPVLSSCPADQVIPAQNGLCEASVDLAPPVIEDACSTNSAMVTTQATATLTSQASPGLEGEVAVDPVELALNITTPLPVNANGNATLTINLIQVDGEGADEYFNVYGENGTLLGITTPTAGQCGNGTTSFTLSPAQLNTWAADGVVAIRLVPNIPAGQPERFAINANCPQPSQVQAVLGYTTNSLNGLTYAYRINNAPQVVVNPIQTVNTTLPLGSHLIRYYVTDCAGNRDSCDYTIMIVDEEAPLLTCPAPIVVDVLPDSCQFTLTLDPPISASDNCGVYAAYQRTLPATPAEALLPFFLDPNLNDYLTPTRVLTFDDVVANAYGDVMLRIDMQGDFNTQAAFFTVFGDDGSTLAVSTIGVADCNTPGQMLITIPAATFNTWAADGTVAITIEPNDITVPPGVPGDGINPCDPMAISMDGDTDGVSYLSATLSYDNLLTRYFAFGATTLPDAPLPQPNGQITATFAVGNTAVSYWTEDLAGNADTCSFTVSVRDVTPPVVTCQPTNLFINPSGLQVEVVNAADVDNGSFDNCGTIDSLWLTPNIFTCNQIGQIVNVTLNARDTSGNVGTCQTIVGIAPDGPMPTANSGLCGGDTLFLFANPPGPSPNVYTYQWFSPSGAPLSPAGPQADIMIPGIDAEDEGPYRVVITGLTGCTAEGVVNVVIQDLPLTPQLNVVGSACLDDAFTLSTPQVPAGTGVAFHWYEGVPPNGILLGTTTTPSFTVTVLTPQVFTTITLRWKLMDVCRPHHP